MDGYATHIEPLIKAALESKGDILELGCGDYSTPLLSAICKSRGSKLVVCASDASWAERYKDLAEIHIVDWTTWKTEGHYGMVFLDNEEHAPGRVARLKSLIPHTDIVVMHDASQAKQFTDFDNVIKSFSRSEMYEKHDPWTVTLWV